MAVHEITDATDITRIKKDERESERVAVLVVESPIEIVGKEFVVESVGIIGRSSSATVVIPEKSVSRKHAFFEFDPKNKRIYIKDLNSTNSTFVNGKKITACYVNPGDRIGLGKVVLRFEIRTRIEQLIREKMEKQAIYDSLTGLLNRATFEQEVKKLVLNNDNFCLIFIDIDNFKNVNDTLGHQKGDELLKGFSYVLKASIRDTDIAARYGGDEIVIVLKKVGSQIALDIISRIKENLKKYFSEQTIDFSYGIAEFPKDSDSLEEVIKKADQRLYENKSKKKSR